MNVWSRFNLSSNFLVFEYYLMVNRLLIQNFLNTFQVRKTEYMKVMSRVEVNSIWNNMNKLPCYKYLNFRLDVSWIWPKWAILMFCK